MRFVASTISALGIQQLAHRWLSRSYFGTRGTNCE